MSFLHLYLHILQVLQLLLLTTWRRIRLSCHHWEVILLWHWKVSQTFSITYKVITSCDKYPNVMILIKTISNSFLNSSYSTGKCSFFRHSRTRHCKQSSITHCFSKAKEINWLHQRWSEASWGDCWQGMYMDSHNGLFLCFCRRTANHKVYQLWVIYVHLMLLLLMQVLKEDAVFLVTTKRSTLDKCPLPVGIRLYVSAGHNASDMLKAASSLKRVAASVLSV